MTTMFMAGAAPLSYLDKQGEPQGIGKAVMDLIEERTGLQFTYLIAHTVEEYFSGEAQIGVGVTPPYAPDWIVTTTPYLVSETIIVAHEELNIAHLEGKTYALLKGGTPPVGIDEDLVKYYNTREATIDAIERKEADYTYGNAYSVAYYMLKNGYENIVMIPQKMESRSYAIGMLKEDPMLFSIIEKAISSIDEATLQTLILSVSSHIERKITPTMIFQQYGAPIIIVVLLIIIALIGGIVVIVHINRELHNQNKRIIALGDLSNEYFFEFFIQDESFSCSRRCRALFDSEESFLQAKKRIMDEIRNPSETTSDKILTLRTAQKADREFKVVTTNILKSRGKQLSITGKLVDVSDQMQEKRRLLKQLQYDGLTALYNHKTVKDLILERLNTKNKEAVDALYIVDVDKFKAINDTHGHLFGDEILQCVAKGLLETFRTRDIIGRIGGDEFCAYIHDIPSPNYVAERCKLLSEHIGQTYKGVSVSVSIGATVAKERDSYESLFKRADDALYQAKSKKEPCFIDL